MGDETAHASNGAQHANRLELLDETVEHVLLQLVESDFILTAPTGGVTRWGDRAKLLFGWDTERIVGSSVFETVLGGGGDEGPVRHWERFLAEREGDPPPARFAVEARHCDGPEFPLELTFVPVKLSQGSEFSFFVRDLIAELPAPAKLARLRREHKDVLQSISDALSHGTPLEPEERLAGVLVAYAATGPTPWVESARRDAEEAAAALADVAQVGEGGAAADRVAQALAKAKRTERTADAARSEREALKQQLTTAVERSEQAEREGAAIRQALDAARKQAGAADEHAERAQSEAESARGDATQAVELVRDLERQTQEVREQLSQARGESGEGAQRLAALEWATKGATERLGSLEQRGREDAERLTRFEDGARDEASRLEALEREGGEQAARLAGVLEQAESAESEGRTARDEAQGLGQRLDDALEKLAAEQLARAELDAAAARESELVEQGEPAVLPEVSAALEQVEHLRAQAEQAQGALGELRIERAQAAALLDDLARGVDEALAKAPEAADAGRMAEDAGRRAGEASAESERAAAQATEVRAALGSLRGELEELQRGREEMRAEADGAREAARTAGGEASRSAGEAERAREELADVREELAVAKAEAGEVKAEAAEVKAELAEARELVASVREIAESARAGAESAAQAGEQAREAAESGEQALRLAGEAGEQAGAAAQRSEEIKKLLEEIGGEVERADADSSTARDELASLRTEAEEMLRLLERSVGRALAGAPPAGDAWVERPAPLPAAGPVEQEPESEPAAGRAPRPGFDDVGAPMAVLNLEGRFIELNPVFCELVGYTEQEFTTAIWPSSLTDDATRKEHRELRGRLATGEIEQGPIETCYLHKEGLLIPVSGTVSLVREDDGSPGHLLLSGAADRVPVTA